MFRGPEEVTNITIGENNRAVAGVVHKICILDEQQIKSENSVELAMMGRVFCRVIGKIRKGDMLVRPKTKWCGNSK